MNDDRGHELQYSIYISDETFPEEEDAIEYLNTILRKLWLSKHITDFDGSL